MRTLGGPLLISLNCMFLIEVVVAVHGYISGCRSCFQCYLIEG